MEKLVRPFQFRDIGPPRPVPSADSAEQAPTVLKFGQGASAKIMFGSVTIDETFYAIKKMRELKRDT